MNIFVLGTSHVHCLAEALDQQLFSAPPGDHIEVIDIRSLGPETPDIRENVIAHMAQCAQPDKPAAWFSRLGGNEHNILGLLRYPRAFDVILPERPDLPLDDGVEILTYGYIRESMRRHILMQRYLAILKAMRDRINAPVYHVEAPPPKRDDQFIREHLDPLLRGAVVDNEGVYEIVNEHLRFKLWRIHSDLVRDECRKINVSYLSSPSDVSDEDGFLHPEGYAPDATHGNAWYGARILAMVCKAAHHASHDKLEEHV